MSETTDNKAGTDNQDSWASTKAKAKEFGGATLEAATALVAAKGAIEGLKWGTRRVRDALGKSGSDEAKNAWSSGGRSSGW